MDEELRDDFELFNNAGGDSAHDFYVLRLYITGMTPNSVRAVRNIRNICSEYLKEDEYSLEILDIYQNPEFAKEEDVIVTPTLVKKAPGVECRLVGDLSNTSKVLERLGIRT